MTTANINVRRILLKRGTTAASEQYVGLAGEVTIDTDLDTLRVHDGSTAGGFLMPGAVDVENLNSTIANANQALDSVSVALVENTSALGNLESRFASLETVAFTGNYADLYDVPTLVSQFTNDADYANVAYIDERISNVIDLAPGALDTLNELAAALGDDANFASNVTATLATKFNTADFSNTANSWLAGKTTTNVAEGTRLYYTTARANADFDVRFATKNTTYLAEGVNQYYTNTRVQTKLADVSGNIIPRTNATYNLGSPDKRFKDLYLSGQTLYLGNVVLTDDQGALKVTTASGDLIPGEMETLHVRTVFGERATDALSLDAIDLTIDAVTTTVNGETTFNNDTTIAGNLISVGDVTVSANVNAGHVYSDLTGHVFSDGGTMMVNSATGRVTGFVENLLVDTALLNVGNITVKTGGTINLNGENIAQVGTIDVAQVNASGIAAGAVTTGQVTINDDGIDLGNTGVLYGPVVGDVTGNVAGSVFADVGSIMVDAVHNKIYADSTNTIATYTNLVTNLAGAVQITAGTESGVSNAVFINPQGTNGYIISQAEHHIIRTGPLGDYSSPSLEFVTAGALTANNGAYFAGDLTGDVTGQVSDISNHTTTDLAEGTNLYYTDTRVKNAISAVDAGGDGSLTYSSTTGAFTYTGPSESEVWAHFSAGTGIDFVNGVISISQPVGANDAVTFDTVVAEVYGNVTGNVTGQVSDISNHTTDELAEGATNLYFTQERARGSITVTNIGGDGSIAYTESGAIEYTGPSSAEVRAHFSAGTGVTYSSNGVFSIGQSVGTSDNVTFKDIVISGNLTVSGQTTTVNATNTTVKDNIIVLNDGETGAGVTAGLSGIEIDRGTGGSNAGFMFDETVDRWTSGWAGIYSQVDGFYGNLVGEVTGNVVGNLTGDVTGSLTGYQVQVNQVVGTGDVNFIRAGSNNIVLKAAETTFQNVPINATAGIQGDITGNVYTSQIFGPDLYGISAFVNNGTEDQLVFRVFPELLGEPAFNFYSHVDFTSGITVDLQGTNVLFNSANISGLELTDLTGIVDGNPGYVLTTDGGGQFTFTDVMTDTLQDVTARGATTDQEVTVDNDINIGANYGVNTNLIRGTSEFGSLDLYSYDYAKHINLPPGGPLNPMLFLTDGNIQFNTSAGHVDFTNVVNGIKTLTASVYSELKLTGASETNITNETVNGYTTFLTTSAFAGDTVNLIMKPFENEHWVPTLFSANVTMPANKHVNFNNVIVDNFDANISGEFNGTSRGIFTGDILAGDEFTPVLTNINGVIPAHFYGEVTGNVFASNSALIINAATGKLVGDVQNNNVSTGTLYVDTNITATGGVATFSQVQVNSSITGDLTGNVVGNLTGDTVGTHTGSVIGDITGNTSGTHIGTVIGNITGDVTGELYGNVNGSVIGDDSAIIVNAATRNIIGNVIVAASYIGDSANLNVASIQASARIGDIWPWTDDASDIGRADYRYGNVYAVNFVGDVTGNVYGATIGDITGNVTGDVTGNLTGDVTGNVTGTTASVDTVEADTVVSKSSGAIAVQSNITFSGTTSGISYNDLSDLPTTSLYNDANVQAYLSGGTATNVVVYDLTVLGTTTTLNTETINLADNIILLNSNEAGTPSQSAGIAIERGTESNKYLLWDEVNDYWTVNSDHFKANSFIGNIAGTVTGDVTGNLTGDVTGNLTGDVTGQVSDISNHTTTDLAEGTNLYYTDARFDARLATKTTTNLAEGTNLYYTDARARSAVSVGSNLEYSSATGQFDLGANVLVSTATGTTGQVPFVVTQGTSDVAYDYVLRSGDFIETADELTAAQNKVTDFATVFNSWYRFSHSTTYTFPANASELSAWSYNSVAGTVECTTNSGTYIGFVSAEVYENYLHEVRLSSVQSDNDVIALVLAFYTDPATGYEYTLSAVRDHAGMPVADWSIVYNFRQPNEWTVTENAAALATPVGNWNAEPTGTLIRVTREGDSILAETTNFGSDTYVAAANLTVDLSSDPRLQKFRGPSAYGYACYSQGGSTFDVLRFEDPSQSIYDLRDGSYYLKQSGTWTLQGENIWESVGVGKFLINPTTGKMYFINSATTVIRVGNYAVINENNVVNVPSLKLDGYATVDLPAATEGTMVFDSDTKQFKGWNGTSWVVLG